MYLGSTTLAWSSDYAQFYLVDAEDAIIEGIDTLGDAAFSARYHVAPNGLVVYTADCLRQEIRITLHDGEPAPMTSEPVSERPWTHTVHTTVEFPSEYFALSSPSGAGDPRWRPRFPSPARRVMARIHWCELDEARYDAHRTLPDVTLWPAPT
jgi:hypothetical protein